MLQIRIYSACQTKFLLQTLKKNFKTNNEKQVYKKVSGSYFYNVPKFVVDIWFSTNQAKYDPDLYGSGFALQIVALYIVHLGG